MTTPNIAMLGNWITSWIQNSSAIYGFHNHSVWGGNPYRWADFTSGHSTWASPFIAGISLALKHQMHADGLSLLRGLIAFQTHSFQQDGQYRHIGFQIGESLQFGLIHNAITNVSLGLAALNGVDYLPSDDRDAIAAAILKNMAACQAYGAGRASHSGIANQDYARIWGKLLFQQAFGDDRWRDEIVEDLDFMISHFHVGGFPDNECEATYRSLSDPNTVEPAEYYGLMICPLVLAYEVYGDSKYLEHAGRLCLHVARSAWADVNEQTRFHRLWFRQGDTWHRNRQPMLISGMGDSLEGINRYVQHVPNSELIDFLGCCDATYAAYQNPRGYFAAATGWQSEIDIAPSSAWHAHDFRYLVTRHALPIDFWHDFFAPYDRTTVLLGDQCLWLERGPHWKIADYFWQDVFLVLGRKDEPIFGRDMLWVGGSNALPDHFKFPDPPVFLKTDDGIYLKQGDPNQLDITSIAAMPYKGVL